MDFDREELLNTLKTRFESNMNRHNDIKWSDVNEALVKSDKLEVLYNMEYSGGEPDVVLYDASTNEYVFYDCAKETPIKRRNLCYDKEALDARKNFKPENSAVNLAKTLGIQLLTEEEYKYLQSLGDFDLKTSSWLKTPDNIRKLGGAIFGDKRYATTFIYHNGAESYYNVRGFRGSIRI